MSWQEYLALFTKLKKSVSSLSSVLDQGQGGNCSAYEWQDLTSISRPVSQISLDSDEWLECHGEHHGERAGEHQGECPREHPGEYQGERPGERPGEKQGERHGEGNDITPWMISQVSTVPKVQGSQIDNRDQEDSK